MKALLDLAHLTSTMGLEFCNSSLTIDVGRESGGMQWHIGEVAYFLN